MNWYYISIQGMRKSFADLSSVNKNFISNTYYSIASSGYQAIVIATFIQLNVVLQCRLVDVNVQLKYALSHHGELGRNVNTYPSDHDCITRQTEKKKVGERMSLEERKHIPLNLI